ncbi:MAG TPA: cupin domain-containing protein [Thermoleophilaceae bacterium]|nr:cupin domain-containing protein [Thermoleophilaceae bacterium]
MRHWDLLSLSAAPDAPEVDGPLSQTARVLASTSEARVVALHLPAGGRLQDHEVHERAWLVVLEGEVEVETEDGTVVRGGTGLFAEFEPRERHEVRALAEARMLLVLTPWPGDGHPGSLSIDEKHHVRERARERAAGEGS